jgi:hypothetical protein
MRVPSYLKRAVEPWTKTSGPVDVDAELDALRAATDPILARGADGVDRVAGPTSRHAKVIGEAGPSSGCSYDRGTGHGAYAVRAGVGLPPPSSEVEEVEDEEVEERELIDPGELSPEEEEARREALAEYEPDESRLDFMERAAWRNYKRNRFRERVEAERFRFGEREEMVVARRFDDMYRRLEEDFEFELMMRNQE